MIFYYIRIVLDIGYWVVIYYASMLLSSYAMLT